MDWLSNNLAGEQAALPDTLPEDSFVFPVTFAQQRMWFLNRLQPGSTFYNSPWSLRLAGPLNVPALEQSLGEIVRRHEILRTTFSVQDGEPVQVVTPSKDFCLPVLDLSKTAGPEAEAKRVALEETRRLMDLEKGPLMRAELLRIGPEDHVLLIMIHHIIFDGWSRRVLSGEMADLYEAFSSGKPSPLPDLALQYGDYAVWQQKLLSGSQTTKQLDYWKRQLEGAPLVLELPIDRLRPAIATYRGARRRVVLPNALLEDLRELSRAEGVTLFMTLLAVFNIVLSRYTAQEDILVGTPVAGRNRVEIEKLIGLFINSLALRTDLTGDPTFRELLSRVRETTLSAYANQDVPFERLVEELHVERDLSRNPVFQVMLILQNIPGKPKGLANITTSVFTDGAETSKMDLMLFAIERADHLETTFEYNTDLFDESTISRLQEHFRIMLEAVVKNPGQRISQFEILAPEERQQLLGAWNETSMAYPRERALHELWERQAEQTPQAIALICGDRQLTYQQLNAQANQVARALAKRGAGPETLVAICIDRTPEMLAGLLGILKAGGAYLPLDPEYPKDRLGYILEDAQASLLVTMASLRDMLPEFAGQRLYLDTDRPEIAAEPEENLPHSAGPDNTAYVLYTSGSTGKPKGVQLTHRNVVNFLSSMQHRPGITADDTLLAVTTLSFDIAGLELYLPLVTGARVVLASRDQARDAGELLALMDRWNVTILQATPVTWWMLLEAGWNGNPRLKALCGGEALPADLAGQLVDRCGELWNMYGPTETTIWSSIYQVQQKPQGTVSIGRVSIGRPIGNTTMYVLDAHDRPQPVGVAGELYIGGDGVGRGYWKRPELTAEKFLADPFRPGERMYRTGDLARFLPDGNLQYLSRADFQVKLRGFRIELGEIEAVLDRHPLVSQSVVLLREDEPGLQRLVAYVVPAPEKEDTSQQETLSEEQVSQWAITWDASYSEGGNVQDATLNLSGWNSSYTHQPIPPEEMRAWVDSTVERILALHPNKVWEIGCGTGLLLFRIAKSAGHYHGTDVSQTALTFIRRQLQRPEFSLFPVSLTQRPAHERGSGAGEEQFDLVIVNSVIQYFPNVGYLVRVLESAVESVASEGSVFIGDVRNLRLLKEFHTSVQWFQSPDSLAKDQFLQRVALEVQQEGELLIDPDFFLALRKRIPRISRVEIQLKRGLARNEMTRFRYDVTLHVGKPVASTATPATLDWKKLDWKKLGLNLNSLCEMLRETQPETLVISGVPDSRLTPEIALLQLLKQEDGTPTVGELRATLSHQPHAPGLEPEDLWALEQELPYRLEIRPAQSPGTFDVLFRRQGPDSGQSDSTVRFPSETETVRPWENYANNPLRQQQITSLVPQVREWLTGKLPDYMVPSAFVLLEAIPLSLNGKVNRRALPAPEFTQDANTAHIEPRTEIEKRVAGIWSEVLHISRIGVEDNFFSLGGHSLLATQVMSRLKNLFQVDLPLRTIFELPSVAELAKRIEDLRREELGPDLPALKRVPHQGPIPLSFTQQRLWFLHQMEPLNTAYNIPYIVRLAGKLEAAVLEQSINEILRRHESLRTHFEIVDGEPTQVIEPWTMLPLTITDLNGTPPEQREAAARLEAKSEATRPFPLSTGPLFRARLFRLDHEDHVLVLTTHHISSDGWSIGVLRTELQTLYEAFVNDLPSPLEELSIQYADYTVWQRNVLSGDQLQKQIAYWKQNLQGAPSLLELPTDRPRPLTQTFAGAKRLAILPSALLEDLQKLSRQEGATLFMTLLGAFSVLLSRYSGQEDIVIGSPVAGRRHMEVEKLIGFFVNTLVLRTDLTGEPSFRDLLKRVKETSLGADAHQDIPFEKLVEELQPERNPGHQPLFQVMLVLQNVPAGKQKWQNLTTQPFSVQNETSKFDLTLIASESPNGLRLNFEYKTDLFDDATIGRMLGHLEVLLTGIVKNPEMPVAVLPILTEAEERQILVEWNDTSRPYPDQCIHQLFEAQAWRAPQAIAVVYQDRQVSYSELESWSNRLANHLRGLGVKPETRVGIYLDRSPEMIAGLLGILKAGGAYVPLEPGFPAERLSFLIRNAELQVILTSSALSEQLPLVPDHLVLMDRQDQWITTNTAGGQPNPDSLAYVIYTSGSTGEPKGVETPHHAVVRLLFGVDYATFGPEEVFLQAATLSFDASTFEVWGALLHGGKIVIYPERVPTLELLGQIIAEHRISIMWLTSSLFNWVIDAAPEILSRVRQVLTGGEALSSRHVHRALEVLPDTQLINGYGPTETTTFAVCYRIPGTVGELIPIGRPIGNTTAYVLDRQRQLVPVGVPGELYLGGAGLARGYLGQPALTSEKFIQHTFPDHAERLYATGDLVRYLPNGLIDFLGRRDDQVKIRGFRIEPGEVEVVLGRHPAVRDCIVIVRTDQPGEKRLVAYLVAHTGNDAKPDLSEMRAWLKERMPDYMVPSAIVPLQALPISPTTGKVDRKALPAPDYSSVQSEENARPLTLTEEALAGIWEQVLRVPRVGAASNFFELGGHSLLATQVVSRLTKTFQVELPLRHLFEEPTLAGLATRIESAQLAQFGLEFPPLVPAGRGPTIPLSFVQQRLWFLDQLDPLNAVYNVPYIVRLSGALNVPALEASLNEIVRRHEALRTRFEAVDGEPSQVIEAARHFALPVIQLADSVPEEGREAEARRLAKNEAALPFNLRLGPLLRACLIRLSEHDHVLVVTVHHIVSDGWSLTILRRELAALYQAFVHEKPSPLEELPVQYADYTIWQRQVLSGEQLEKQLNYWKAQLQGAPAILELPTDRPRPAVETFRGASRSVILPLEMLEGLRGLARSEGSTLFMVVLGAFSVLLSRYSGQEDLVVGSPIAGRHRFEIEKLIGLFVNTLVLRVNQAGDPTFRELLRQIRETTIGAYAHQDLPFERLVEELQPERDLSRNPLFQVMVILQNMPGTTQPMDGLTVSGFNSGSQVSKFDLTLITSEQTDGLRVALEYNTDLFDPSTIDRMLGHYRVLLEGIIGQPDSQVSELPLVSAEELHRLLIEFNNTAVEHPKACLHSLISQQAERSPQSIAVVYGNERITYSDLNTRSNRLANYLAKHGAGPDVLIAICCERNIDLLVGIIGILKSGSAYVPMDPHYPKERLKHILEGARAHLIVTQNSLVESFPLSTAEILCLDSDWEKIACEPEVALPVQVRPEHLAYVLFTSGSTGKPKGVALEHHSAAAFVLWAKQAFSEEELSGVLLSTSVCFDLSVFEIFVTLCAGGKIILAENALYLPTLPAREEVTLINTVPSAMAELVRIGAVPQSVTVVNLAGEALPDSLVEAIYSTSRVTKVYNLYGPTEDTTYSTYTFVPRGVPVTIGSPISNTQAYILDARFQSVPIGVPGELYLAGEGLARGYYGQPELTSERFLPHPFEPHARVYRTGDLCRWLPNGTIQYLGRLDHQVKLRGFRIELGEIEAVLNRHPEVRQSLVIVREDHPGLQRLVAYVVAYVIPHQGVPDGEQLRNHVKNSLPEFMVPAAVIVLDAFPLTPNGKVDRKALAPPGDSFEARARYVAPRTPVEASIAEIWADMLKVDRVGVEDNFFELGGHSLLAVQVFARMEKITGKKLSLDVLFRSPTIAQIAAFLPQSSSPAETSIRPCRTEGSRPPIYAVHGIGGTVLTFRNIVANLEPDQPVYALEAFGNDRSWTCLEELAALYVKDILAFQPKGPYHLIGSSFGGMVIFEMARQLNTQGHEVGLLGMLDSGNMGSRNLLTRKKRMGEQGKFLQKRTLMHLRRFKDRKWHEWPRYAAGRLFAVGRRLHANAWRFLYKYYKVPDKLPPALLNMKRVYEAAGMNYMPKKYAGTITLFLAIAQSRENARKNKLGWAGWADQVEVIEVPGDHNSMVQEPNVKVLTAEITGALTRYAQATSQMQTSPS